MGLEHCCGNNQALLLMRTSALFCEMPRSISKEQKLPAKGYENLSLLGCEFCRLFVLS